jgi:uncharacterized protein
MKKKIKIGDILWDLWCVVSVVGIWPRFIEPNTIKTNRVKIKIPNLPPSLKGLKILQFSDLHLNKGMTNHFLRKLHRKIEEAAPDIITYTGDFLCYGKFPDKERLKHFFQSIPRAPYGNYAIMGNHDYTDYICVNEDGDYDVGRQGAKGSVITRGFQRLSKKLVVSGKVTPEAANVPINEELIDLINETSFKLFHNETVTIPIHDTKINICGLGEHMLGRLNPDEAYKNYDKNYPGIILVHNPDGVPYLKNYPGEVILCGHTHGGQVNLPWMSGRFIVLENIQYKHGLFSEGKRWIYVNRGVGGVMNFRWFCIPELLLLELDTDD